MSTMHNTMLAAAAVGLGGVTATFEETASGCGWQTPAPTPEAVEAPRTIDLAICLDTSGSMSGLINAAKQKLWAIVNELAMATPTPKLRVALLTFGNTGHDPENGWVRVDAELTDDLDLISKQLFGLSTNGGEEYVGRVLQFADQLDWHPSDDALKLIMVAGNESADQDQEVPFREMCRSLIARGIMINSIYCGPPTDNIAPGWQEVAKLADGQFASIDQDNGTIVVASPFDDELAALSSSLNETYIPLGAAGQAGRANQSAQDANAAGLNSATAAARAKTKAQGLYYCSWDLVDACTSGQVKLEEIAADALPEAMRAMTPDQRSAYLEQMSSKRAGIKQKIEAISANRDAFVQAQMKKNALDGSKGFDDAIRSAVREQAEAKGFRFEEPEADREAEGERKG